MGRNRKNYPGLHRFANIKKLAYGQLFLRNLKVELV
jgi:hypothetical protein